MELVAFDGEFFVGEVNHLNCFADEALAHPGGLMVDVFDGNSLLLEGIDVVIDISSPELDSIIIS